MFGIHKNLNKFPAEKKKWAKMNIPYPQKVQFFLYHCFDALITSFMITFSSLPNTRIEIHEIF